MPALKMTRMPLAGKKGWLLVSAMFTAAIMCVPALSGPLGTVVLSALILWLFATISDRLTTPLPLPYLQSRAVLITGCDSGFGLELALRLDLLGVPVFAGCLSETSEGAERLRRLCSSKTHVLHLDVTSDQLVQDAVTYVRDNLRHNKLWAVVNNAGIADCGEVEIQPLEAMRRVEDVNLWGAVRVTKAFLPMLRESRGRVVCVGSVMGRISLPFGVAYCMSKHALRAFCDSLRVEMKPFGVSVHLIEPGGYKTKVFSYEAFNTMRVHFQFCPISVVEAYGGREYLKKAVDVFRRLYLATAKSADAITEVVDEMAIAAIGDDPKMRHIPGFLEPFVYSVIPVIPRAIIDVVLSIGMTPVYICKQIASKKEPLPME